MYVTYLWCYTALLFSLQFFSGRGESLPGKGMFNQSIESQQTAGKHKAGKQLSHHLILAAQQHDTPPSLARPPTPSTSDESQDQVRGRPPAVFLSQAD